MDFQASWRISGAAGRRHEPTPSQRVRLPPQRSLSRRERGDGAGQSSTLSWPGEHSVGQPARTSLLVGRFLREASAKVSEGRGRKHQAQFLNHTSFKTLLASFSTKEN